MVRRVLGVNLWIEASWRPQMTCGILGASLGRPGGLPGGKWRPGGFPLMFWGPLDGVQRSGIRRWPAGSWGLTWGLFLQQMASWGRPWEFLEAVYNKERF